MWVPQTLRKHQNMESSQQFLKFSPYRTVLVTCLSIAHRQTLCDSAPKLCDAVLPLPSFRCRGSVSRGAAVRESGDSVGKANSTPQAGLCNYLCLKDTMSPSTLPLSHSSPREAVPYSLITSLNTPGFHSLFLHRGTNLHSPPLQDTIPPSHSPSPTAQSLPSAFLTIRS